MLRACAAWAEGTAEVDVEGIKRTIDNNRVRLLRPDSTPGLSGEPEAVHLNGQM